MVGADICGFSLDSNAQLCGRWFYLFINRYQLGVLYPFSRNHNEFYGLNQEPYAFDEDMLNGAINNLNLRY